MSYVHAPTEGKSDDTKDSFYEKPERVYGEKMFLNDQSGMKAHVKWSYCSKLLSYQKESNY
jgi:hypothetical protein